MDLVDEWRNFNIENPTVISIYRKEVKSEQVPDVDVLFPDTNRSNADENIGTMIKFIINYMFYKFGVEFTLAMMVINASDHADIFGTLYTITVLPVFLCKFLELKSETTVILLSPARRSTLRKTWFVLCIFLFICVIAQLVLYLSFPPTFCLSFPWESWDLCIHQNVEFWLALPTFPESRPMSVLLGDVIMVSVAFAQLRVFYREQKQNNTAANYGTFSAEGGILVCFYSYQQSFFSQPQRRKRSTRRFKRRNRLSRRIQIGKLARRRFYNVQRLELFEFLQASCVFLRSVVFVDNPVCAKREGGVVLLNRLYGDLFLLFVEWSRNVYLENEELVVVSGCFTVTLLNSMSRMFQAMANPPGVQRAGYDYQRNSAPLPRRRVRHLLQSRRIEATRNPRL